MSFAHRIDRENEIELDLPAKENLVGEFLTRKSLVKYIAVGQNHTYPRTKDQE
jgi:hypothetical protein